jgi:hypothetical protein
MKIPKISHTTSGRKETICDTWGLYIGPSNIPRPFETWDFFPTGSLSTPSQVDLFKEKSFHLLEETMKLVGNLKGKKWKKLLNISKNRVFINRSQIFIALPKCYVTHRNYKILSKSLVPN